MLKLVICSFSTTSTASSSNSDPVRPSQAAVEEYARYASLIRQCGDSKALSHGKHLHAQVAQSRLDAHTFMANLLIEMYGKCGSVHDARAVFDRMQMPNVFSWTIMISAYTRNGCSMDALVLFRRMDLEGVHPNKVTFLGILGACSNLADLSEGRRIHARIVACNGDFDAVISTALVNMYGKCGSVEDARQEFEELRTRSVIAWNAMLTAYAQNGYYEDAIELYQRMDLEGVKPDTVTFLTILSACFSPEALELGKSVHAHAIACCLEKNNIVGNCLINMYGKCGSLENAKSMFDDILHKNEFSWAIMVAAYTQNGYDKEAIQLFHQMDLNGTKADRITFVNVLVAFSSSELLADGRLIHERLAFTGFESDIFVGTAIVNMYAKCGSMDEARSMFERLDKRDVVLWNAMMAAYAQNDQGQDALKLYQRMCLEGIKPNEVTYATVMDACSTLGAISEGQNVYNSVNATGLDSSLLVENSLVNMFGKCGSLTDARRVFDKMRERNVCSWTAMIEAYIQHGYNSEALVLFEQMDFESVEPNEFTFTSILDACSSLGALTEAKKIHAQLGGASANLSVVSGTALVTTYGKCGSVTDAKCLFDQMGERNVVTWNAMLESYTQNGYSAEALQLFKQMDHEGTKPSSSSFASILNACSSLGLIEEGKSIHRRVVDSGHQLDEVLGISLIYMYGKCGSLEDARGVFKNMVDRNLLAWNALIAAYAHQGHAKGVVSLFQEMHLEGLEPNETTFHRLLHACSHAGLLEQAWEQFIYMREDYGIEQVRKHYHNMIDLLGRAGSLTEAQDLIQNMPFQPGVVAWKSLLGASKMHGDLETGAIAASQASQLHPKDAVPYIMLSNMYAKANP